MASLSKGISRTQGLVIPATIVMVGSLAATVATDFAKNNVYNVSMKGGDAAYPLAVTLLLNMVTGGSTVRLLSLGMVSSSATEVATSYDLI